MRFPDHVRTHFAMLTVPPPFNSQPGQNVFAGCRPNPCSNGGTCLETVSREFVCRCGNGWTGDTCQIGESTIQYIGFSPGVQGRHNGFFISIRSYLLHPPPSFPPRHVLSLSLAASIHIILGLPVSSFQAIPSSASFSQYTHHLSSVHVQTTSVLPHVFSPQTATSALMYSVLIFPFLS